MIRVPVLALHSIYLPSLFTFCLLLLTSCSTDAKSSGFSVENSDIEKNLTISSSFLVSDDALPASYISVFKVLTLEDVISEVHALCPECAVDELFFIELKSRFIRDLATFYGERFVSGAPKGEQNKVTDLTLVFRDDSYKLFWSYINLGDYDLNGEVGVPDITPIALHFAHSRAGIGMFPDSFDDVIDGDNTGEIGVSDITPIAQNYLSNIASYSIQMNSSEGAEFVEVTNVSIDSILGSDGILFFQTDIPQELWEAYRVRVVPLDALGNEGEPSVEIEMRFNGNKLPFARLVAQPKSGSAPLTVTLNAGASYDEDGSIVTYTFDFTNDGVWDQNTGPQSWIKKTYDIPGEYTARVKVRDDRGGYGYASASFTVTEHVNEPPLAVLVADVTNGINPLVVNFDASASFDNDGTIAKYEWDFDGDGTYDLDSELTPSASFTFDAPGNYTATVRVSDDGGLTDTDVEAITVN